MKRKFLPCGIIALLVSLVGLGLKLNQPPSEINLNKQTESISQVTIENVEFSVELAQTPAERKRGLSDRTELCDQCGMLFIFENNDYHSFWMKDTFIPLDIIWIDENWQVVDFAGFVQPQGTRTDGELPIYQSKKLSRYVLELPGGTVKKIREFKIGSAVLAS